MSRRPRQTDAAPGHDSFLDIVANMVGILIILVLVAGVRVKNSPLMAVDQDTPQESSSLKKRMAIEVSLRSDVLKATEEIRTVQREVLAQDRHRNLLATAVSALDQKLNARRQALDAQSQGQFDLGRSLAESRYRLGKLRQDRLELEKTEAKPIEVKSYPTPLSRTVDDREIHFQLRGGRIVLVPVDPLLDLLQNAIGSKKRALQGRAEYADVLGPVNGFRLNYTLIRHEISPEMAMEIGYSGSVIRLKRASFIPVSDDLGEPVRLALSQGSDFRRVLTQLNPGRHTITVWIYPESFVEFRKIKQDLYRSGFSVAGRPLPPGEPISGSPQGTKSAAQ